MVPICVWTSSLLPAGQAQPASTTTISPSVPDWRSLIIGAYSGSLYQAFARSTEGNFKITMVVGSCLPSSASTENWKRAGEGPATVFPNQLTRLLHSLLAKPVSYSSRRPMTYAAMSSSSVASTTNAYHNTKEPAGNKPNNGLIGLFPGEMPL